MLENIWLGAQNAFSLINLATLSFGALIGVVAGIIPGIGPMVGMVVLLPFTFSLPTGLALSLLLGIFCGGYFGGAVPAVLIRTPGVPSSIFTSFDGYPLTQRGEAQTALSSALLGCFGGGVISVCILMFLAPLLAHVAANFGSPEYFSAALLGVVILVIAYRKHLAASLMLVGLGMWMSCVGVDAGTLVNRYDFGLLSLRNGLHIAPVCLGLYGMAQMLIIVERPILQTDTVHLSERTLDFSKLFAHLRYWKTLVRGGIIGTFVALLPGPGSVTASFLSYEAAKLASKKKEAFGQGTPEGCLASEAGNSAVPAGAMIPLLTLGIPGEAIAALLLAIFSLQGIYPGPLLLIKEPVLIKELYFSLLVIQVVSFLILALGLRSLAMIVKVPSTILAPLVMVISAVGIYSINLRYFDVGVALVMAVLGYILHRLGWPIVTLVIGLVLGDILEERLRESLSMSGGSLMIFVDRPISLALIISAVLIVLIPLVIDYRRKRKGMEAPGDSD
jgi:putative tricarboxylic transport membrane protein